GHTRGREHWSDAVMRNFSLFKTPSNAVFPISIHVFRMIKLALALPATPRHHYPILIGTEMISAIEIFLEGSCYQQRKLIIITDQHVRKLYGEALQQTLRQRGYEVLLFSFRNGERWKTAKTKEYLEGELLKHHCGRETLIMALGGGVVGDVAGFVAATYLRGIAYIQLPTTLLAMVDSGVGGKTGVNNAYGKNLIGAFWQPLAVIADLNCLKTLPKKEIAHGLVEAAKMFLTSDANSFYSTQESLPRLVAGNVILLEKLVATAVAIKIDLVQRDEQEHGERMILNFGHTIGHALEKISHYQISHAAAVAVGILVESKISQLLGILSASDFEAINSFFNQLKIKLSLLKKISFPNLLSATRHDKKTRHNQSQYVLLRRIGEVHRAGDQVAHPVKDEIVMQALNHFNHHSSDEE
ncbi:MAG: 3-dehydroquinate synthase, partial [Chthoniobacterales bacterium]|nr:3-dehydroquinate synthase [Chthoniobacterales bacterium]